MHRIDCHHQSHTSMIIVASKEKKALLVKSLKSVSNRKNSPYNNSKCDRWQTSKRNCRTGNNLRKDFDKTEVSRARRHLRIAV